MNVPVITVSQLNGYIKTMFDRELMMQSMLISGEISNFSPHYRTGHLYFSLKDESSSLKAVMFARSAQRLRFQPENGMKVLAIGRVGVFERDGVYQLYVDEMQPDGAGALAVAFEQLKNKLEKEGLFDTAHKKPLPAFPKRIGVITSPNGAAVQDIFNILGRRWPLAEVVFEPVTVQGPKAPYEMIKALSAFERKNCADVIIIGRGGGSAEDLWCFNDELLARKIYECKIPVVSGVGHETDFTICDFVSDLRAPTPSAAAELVTPDIYTLTQETAVLTERLYAGISSLVSEKRARLDTLLRMRSFTDPPHFLDKEKIKISNAFLRMSGIMNTSLHAKREKLASDAAALSTLDPLQVLLRGYCAAVSDNRIIGSVKELAAGQKLTVEMSDGRAECEVLTVTKEKNKWQK